VALAGVARVRAVADDVDVQLSRTVEHRAEAHRPAVIAALAVVLDEVRVRELRELDEFVSDTDLVRDPRRVLEFLRRESLALRRARNSVVAERVVRDRRDDARIDAARERDEHAVELAKVAAGGLEFGLDGLLHCPGLRTRRSCVWRWRHGPVEHRGSVFLPR